MAYNQNTTYGNNANVLPGAHGTGLTEDAYETGRPTDGLMGATGLGHQHHHNQPMAGYGGGASNMKSQTPYDNANIGIAPIGTGIIHDLTSADVNARHHATDAVVAGDLHAGHKTGIVDKVKNAVMPGHQGQQVGSGGAYNTTGTPMGTAGTHMGSTGTTGTYMGTTGLGTNNTNTMFPGGVTDNADVRHQGELIGGSTYPAGQQPMHGAHKPGMIEQIKDKVTGHPHQTDAGYNNDSTYTTGTTGAYNTAPVAGTGLVGGHHDTYNSTATDHVHGQKPGMIEQIKEKVTGHPHQTGAGYNNDSTYTTGTTGAYNTAPVAGTGLVGGHHDTYNSTATDHVHGQKPGMIEQIKEKVTGHGTGTHGTTHAHGHPMTSEGYRTDAVGMNQYPGGVNPNTDVYGHRTEGHAVTTSPTNAYDTTNANVHSQYPGVAPTHTGVVGTHPVEQKPGGIKGLISKVTGH